MLERVLIVGGGIAGLATAAGLRRSGIACEVVERTPQWAPVGAGIVMSVNAMSVLQRIDAAADVVARGHALSRGAVTDAAGKALASSDFAILRPDHGPTIALHRAALHEALLRAAGDVPVALGTWVEGLEPGAGHVTARLSDGRSERFDLVIGADGLRSQVRGLAFGELPLSYSGYTCWRFVVEAPVERIELCEMWGRGLRFGIVPVADDRIYCFAVANAPRGTADPEEGRLARFRQRFAGFGGQVPEILARLSRPDELIHNDLEELVPVRWYAGRVVLVGDAAHAMTPNMGQGAAMALEDAAVLVEELARDAPLEERLARYVRRRAGRVRFVQDQSRRIGRVGQWEGRLATALRNALLRATPDGAAARALLRLARQPI